MSMNDSMDDKSGIAPDIGPAETPLLGRRLAEVREAAGLSIEDISNRLRLSSRQIKALEGDDFTVLPDAMITRGFIRNYARLLELDPEPLLEAYRAYVPSEPPRAISISSENILISDNDRRPWLVYVMGSLLIAVLLGIWLYIGEMPKKPAPQPVPQNITPAPPENPAAESLPVPALPAAERMDETSTPPAEELSLSQDSSAAGAAATPAPATEQATATAANNQPVAATGPVARLRLTFSDKSWVSVIDGNNQEVLNKTKAPGSEELVEGKSPFKIIIGNAAGSRLIYNDKPVNLEPHTRLNVARITLE
jgi:cytoskeleton protein RodZ